MKVLSINFADSGKGIGETSAMRLKKKYGDDNVTLLQAIDDHGHIKTTVQLAGEFHDLHDETDEPYETIIIGAHGLIDDIQHCYTRPELDKELQQLMSHQELARYCHEFLDRIRLLPRSEENTLNLTLAICYGARTAESGRDHIAEAEQIDFRRSFVGEFIQYFRAAAGSQFNFTAFGYTGSVSFHQRSGELCVESEEQIRMSEELRRLDAQQRELEIERDRLLDEYASNNGEDAVDSYIQNEQYTRNETPLDRAYLAYLELEARRIEMKIACSETLPEYGRVVFHINRDRLQAYLDRSPAAPAPRDDDQGAEERRPAADDNDTDESTPLLGQRRGRCCPGCTIS